MARKPKFRPRISRVELNPEQAVLTCECYSNNHWQVPMGAYGSFSTTWMCDSGNGKAKGAHGVCEVPHNTPLGLHGATEWGLTTSSS